MITLDRFLIAIGTLTVAVSMAPGCGASLEVAGAFDDDAALDTSSALDTDLDTDPTELDGAHPDASVRPDGADTLRPPTPDTRDGAPTPDTAPVVDTAVGPDTATTCTGKRWCTFTTGTQKTVGSACWLGTECCSGDCFDAKPGDGVPGVCSVPGGPPSDWCGGRDGASDWCPGAEGKVCAR